MQAKILVPDLPNIDMAKVKSLMMGVIIEGNMMTEMIRKHKIQESHRDVQVMMQQVQGAMTWCASRM
jgi:hypothetical protein